MKSIIALIVFSFSLAFALPPRQFVLEARIDNDEKNTTIHYSTIGERHVLVFPNLLSIPKENYPRFFQRMQHVYHSIQVLNYHQDREVFELHFYKVLPADEEFKQILQKFSILNYDILYHD